MEEEVFPTSWKRAVCTLMIIAGLSIYIYWGFMYGAWNILAMEYVGIWGMVLGFVGIGLAGLLLLKWEEEDRA